MRTLRMAKNRKQRFARESAVCGDGDLWHEARGASTHPTPHDGRVIARTGSTGSAAVQWHVANAANIVLGRPCPRGDGVPVFYLNLHARALQAAAAGDPHGAATAESEPTPSTFCRLLLRLLCRRGRDGGAGKGPNLTPI